MFTSLCIGNFDGVHKGHQALIKRTYDYQKNNPGQVEKSLVLTFHPHPSEVISGKAVPAICSIEKRLQHIREMGIDETHVLSFNKELSQMSALEFLKEHISPLNCRFIVVGKNFYFGKDREGNTDFLVSWAKEQNIECEIFKPLQADGEVISSSLIRSLIDEGQCVRASRLLGRDFQVSAEVIHGEKKGRLLGFPTANMLPVNGQCLPKKGVYLSTSHFEKQSYASVTNVGVKPTLSKAGQTLIESHLLDFDGDLYGKVLSVDFRDRLRDERNFASIDELKQQIQIDTDKARQILGLC